MDGRALSRTFCICVHCAHLGQRDEDSTAAEFVVALTYPKASSPGDTETVRTSPAVSSADPVWEQELQLFVPSPSHPTQLTTHPIVITIITPTAPPDSGHRLSRRRCSRSSCSGQRSSARWRSPWAT